MSLAERLTVWNRWYVSVPEDFRFQFVVWSLIALGAVNMALTIAIGFPFALLVVLGILVLAAIRLPYVFGWITPSEGTEADARFQISGGGWLVDLNRRYEAMPEARRIWVYPAVLLIGGAINMMLTIAYRFPFGLLFLLTLLVLLAIRAPYAAGWFGADEAPELAPVQPRRAEVEHAPVAAIVSEPPPSTVARPNGDERGDHEQPNPPQY